MAKPIAQRIWYMDEQDMRHQVVVRQGDSRFRLEGGVIRGPDSERPGVTLSVPLHRVRSRLVNPLPRPWQGQLIPWASARQTSSSVSSGSTHEGRSPAGWRRRNGHRLMAISKPPLWSP